MNSLNKMIRLPDEYRESLSQKNIKKWNKIIGLFSENRLNDLALNHRSGTRGRILSTLVLELFKIIRIPFKPEPIFYGIKPNEWYINFAKKHNIKLRTHDFYNPDLFLEDGTWIEITLSENTAYKKLFRYGHQADKLTIFWLDNDNGFHKEKCRSICFPNAEIKNIDCFNSQLKKSAAGLEIMNKLKVLKKLNGTIL